MKPLLIEQTEKRWKMLQALGLLIFFSSIILCICWAAIFQPISWITISGIVLLLFPCVTGCIMYVVGRFCGWWYHA